MIDKMRHFDIFRPALLAAIFLFTALPSSAQRTMNGQMALSLDATYISLVKGGLNLPGARLSAQSYTPSGYWDFGVAGVPHWDRLSDKTLLEYVHLRGEGGYMARLFSTRSRSFSLYAGGVAFIGTEWIDPRRIIPASTEVDLGLSEGSSMRLLFGVTPSLEIETFITRGFALTVHGRLPVNFYSHIRLVHLEYGLGFRLSL